MKAFPTDRLGVIKDSRGISINEAQQDGMDLRDYFAAKAMTAFLVGCDDVKDNYNEKGIAIMSYAMADAMMEERK